MEKITALRQNLLTPETLKHFFWHYGIYPLLLLVGVLAAWRLTQVPSREEFAVYLCLLILIPGLKYPRLAFYYILFASCFIPLIRRLYYNLSGRPEIDFLMLATDAAVVAMLASIVMLWVKNKIRMQDKFTLAIYAFMALMLVKIFVLNNGTVINGFYAFKFYGLYISLYFAGSSLITHPKEINRLFLVYGCVLSFTALYSIKQIFFGFFEFEQLWIQSVEFTTLIIEGQVRTFGPFISPASLSDAMSILFAIGCYFLIRKKLSGKLMGLVFCAVCIAPLLYATVRSNWMAGILTVWLFFFLFRTFNWKNVLLNIIVVPLAIVLLVQNKDVDTASTTTAMERVSSGKLNTTQIMITNRTDALVSPLEENSFQKRLVTWMEILYSVIYTHPLGRGLGSSGYAHSHYFQVLGDMGFIGLGLYLFILGVIVSRGFRTLAQTHDVQIKKLCVLLLVLFFIICLLCITGTHLNSHPADIIFWFSCGAISNLFRTYGQKKGEEPAADPS